ncbi:hypothetical protein KUCAC02_001701, partial [Chaenocephalus aceratus]
MPPQGDSQETSGSEAEHPPPDAPDTKRGSSPPLSELRGTSRDLLYLPSRALCNGERESSREGHQRYSARINAFPLAVSPHCTAIVLRKSGMALCTLPSPSMMVIKVHGFQFVDNGKATKANVLAAPKWTILSQSRILQGRRKLGFKHGWVGDWEPCFHHSIPPLMELAQASEGEVANKVLLEEEYATAPCRPHLGHLVDATLVLGSLPAAPQGQPSAKQPVREAANCSEVRCRLSGTPPPPGSLLPLLCTQADIFSLGVKRYPLASGSK